jgi:hypothetical protein
MRKVGKGNCYTIKRSVPDSVIQYQLTMESFLFYLTVGKLFYYESKGICSRSASRLEANDSLLRIE